MGSCVQTVGYMSRRTFKEVAGIWRLRWENWEYWEKEQDGDNVGLFKCWNGLWKKKLWTAEKVVLLDSVSLLASVRNKPSEWPAKQPVHPHGESMATKRKQIHLQMLFRKEIIMSLVIIVKSAFISVKMLPPVCDYNLDWRLTESDFW